MTFLLAITGVAEAVAEWAAEGVAEGCVTEEARQFLLFRRGSGGWTSGCSAAVNRCGTTDIPCLLTGATTACGSWSTVCVGTGWSAAGGSGGRGLFKGQRSGRLLGVFLTFVSADLRLGNSAGDGLPTNGYAGDDIISGTSILQLAPLKMPGAQSHGLMYS